MQTEEIRLIEPTLKLEQAYRDYLREFIEAGEESSLYHSREETINVAACIRKLQQGCAKSLNLSKGQAPSSVYWLLSERGNLLGDIQIRHRLTPAWKDLGGHIDYAVRPSQRRKGYATRMLAMALEKARALGLRRILVTCDPANAGSAGAIRKNGGRLFSESAAKNGRLTSRYWIPVRPPGGHQRPRVLKRTSQGSVRRATLLRRPFWPLLRCST